MNKEKTNPQEGQILSLEENQINIVEKLISLNELDSALQILTEMLQFNSNNLLTLNNLSVVYFLKNNPREAKNIVDRILSIDPTNETALNNLGIIIASLEKDISKTNSTFNGKGITNKQFEAFSPAGHFYSPIPEMNEIINNYELMVKNSASTHGINFNEEKQIALFNDFSKFFNDLPYKDKKHESFRYYFVNGYFQHGDAVITQSFLRHFKPNRVIEIGSGFSSALMLDTSDYFLNSNIKFTFIEPYTERLKKLLSRTDNDLYTIIEKGVQEVPLTIYDTLNEGDILFVDSSHIVKLGSNVNFIISEVFPILKKGVIIHIHDMFYPFQYPKQWFLEGRAWNEAYFVKTFLQYNDTFSIMFFNSYMLRFHKELLTQKLPSYCTDCGCGLWLRKEK